MMQPIETRLDSLKDSFVSVFVDSDRDLVEYYMQLFIKKFRTQESEIVRVAPLGLHTHVASMGFFKKEKILLVMQIDDKDYDALTLNCEGVRVLVYASTTAALKKIQKAVPGCGVIDNSAVKHWHRNALLAQELQNYAANSGVKISSSCAQYFITRVGQSFAIACQELKKVMVYCSGGAITREAVDRLVGQKDEENFFVLAKQILFGKKLQAKSLFDVGEVFSLFVALRYQIYIALNLVNGTSDAATERTKGADRQDFMRFIEGKGTSDLLSILKHYFTILCQVREHKIKPNSALAHFLLPAEVLAVE